MYLVSRINITLSYDNESNQGGLPTLMKLMVNTYTVFLSDSRTSEDCKIPVCTTMNFQEPEWQLNHAFRLNFGVHTTQTKNWTCSSAKFPQLATCDLTPEGKHMQVCTFYRTELRTNVYCQETDSLTRRQSVSDTPEEGVHNVELSSVQRLTKMLSSSGYVSILVLWWKVTG